MRTSRTFKTTRCRCRATVPSSKTGKSLEPTQDHSASSLRTVPSTTQSHTWTTRPRAALRSNQMSLPSRSSLGPGSRTKWNLMPLAFKHFALSLWSRNRFPRPTIFNPRLRTCANQTSNWTAVWVRVNQSQKTNLSTHKSCRLQAD